MGTKPGLFNIEDYNMAAKEFWFGAHLIQLFWVAWDIVWENTISVFR